MAQQVVRWLTAASFAAVGVLHFTHAHVFLLMMPPWLPWHLELVWLSGAFEILGAVGLLVPRTRRVAAWGLLALLVAVFPANVHMAVAGVELPVDALPQSEAGRWIRLPFQLVIAAQVAFAGLWRPPTRGVAGPDDGDSPP
ncbi:MAG: DoxX family protein [Alphaproteobacteria bacterium]|nr:DoxX family protein [Alphaproteobacteria bacterium]